MSAEQAFGHRQNYRTTRAEYLGVFAVAAVAFLWHIDEVRWGPAILLFVYIDVIGYIPGLIAYTLSRDGRIHPVFHILYNVMHTWLSAGLVILLWVWQLGPEWALLVVPLHLFGDRGLLGNYAKPVSEPFEHFETGRQKAFRAARQAEVHTA
ncbi:hypothetical protein [Streptomyces capitiformicae]|uniref:Integral membrane protein n=1 Tax=Streptomyces capitiformicae TaxID=2014920 RepID=A0A919DIL8_9ACTN|nr:hypothetical protein [Streptomyces capitiformicae]GHE48333.1 hypothetical protein GCM10017771_69450 [Streptomyces capitiformicae]